MMRPQGERPPAVRLSFATSGRAQQLHEAPQRAFETFSGPFPDMARASPASPSL